MILKYLMALMASIVFATSIIGQDTGFTTKWSHGFKVESNDGAFEMKFGGRVMYDFAFFSQDDQIETKFGALKSGSEFRRIRFFNSGRIYNNVSYKLELDFIGGRTTFKDAYLQFSQIPIIENLRVGQFKEPFRLDVLSSSNYITFMERSFHTAFTPVRNSGLMIINESENRRIGWQVSLLTNADTFGDSKTRSDLNLTMRLTGLVLKDDIKHHLVHVGIAYSHRSPKDEEYSARLRPSSHLAPRYLSTGTIEEIKSFNLINMELAVILGAFSVQSEYILSSVDAKDGSVSLSSFYTQVSYFLTGEHRKYESSYDGFGRIEPRTNAGLNGKGAWGLAARYSTFHFDEGPISGRGMKELVIGINWHLNPATRIMFNYVHTYLKDVGRSNIFETRFQVDF